MFRILYTPVKYRYFIHVICSGFSTPPLKIRLCIGEEKIWNIGIYICLQTYVQDFAFCWTYVQDFAFRLVINFHNFWTPFHIFRILHTPTKIPIFFSSLMFRNSFFAHIWDICSGFCAPPLKFWYFLAHICSGFPFLLIYGTYGQDFTHSH